MAETNEKRLAAIKGSHALRKKRKRSAALHITVTEGEREEFRQIAERHGMLDRELLMNAVRAFKTTTQRLDSAEARLTLLEARLDKLEQPEYRMPE